MIPSLTIRLTKRDDGRHVLTLIRPDGAVTGTRLNLPVEHDLIHYAVETKLNLQNSFYSLIARGFDLAAFSTAAGRQRLNLPDEAIWTEFVVGLLQVELNDGVPFDDFAARLREACGTLSGPDVTLDATALARIRARIGDLLARWRSLPLGQTLELHFGR